MTWKNWKQKRNVIPVASMDILSLNQKLIIDTQRGITYDAQFARREKGKFYIFTLFPVKAVRPLKQTEIAYRKKNDLDIKRATKAVENLTVLLTVM